MPAIDAGAAPACCRKTRRRVLKGCDPGQPPGKAAPCREGPREAPVRPPRGAPERPAQMRDWPRHAPESRKQRCPAQIASARHAVLRPEPPRPAGSDVRQFGLQGAVPQSPRPASTPGVSHPRTPVGYLCQDERGGGVNKRSMDFRILMCINSLSVIARVQPCQNRPGR